MYYYVGGHGHCIRLPSCLFVACMDWTDADLSILDAERASESRLALELGWDCALVELALWRCGSFLAPVHHACQLSPSVVVSVSGHCAVAGRVAATWEPQRSKPYVYVVSQYTKLE